MLADLTGTPGLNLVERQSLETVLRELNMSWSGLVRAKDAVRVGKLLKVDWFLLGTEAKIKGSNSIVVRIVDARTGILRDAGVFPAGKPPTELAADMATFVRQTRQNAASAEPRIYLAIGTFEDLGVNNRQAAFPTQLRGYLTAAFQGGKVTLLEREYVNTLLQEMHLDLAGLTEESGTNAPVPVQSAYWLVDGYYQSYETTNYEVEVVINVERMFGRRAEKTFRGLPNEAMFKNIKNGIDAIMGKNATPVIVSRVSEVRAQMSAGRELAKFGATDIWLTGSVDSDGYNGPELDEQETARQRRNAGEAIKAFETVLLLEPTNREAKICLAACFRKKPIGRVDEARDYYREILEEPVQDKLVGIAQGSLICSLWMSSPKKVEWFERAAQLSTNLSAGEFYRQNARSAQEDLVVYSGKGEPARKLAEERLFQAVRQWDGELRHHNTSFHHGMNEFVKAYGTNNGAAARRLVELLPQLQAATPDLAPHLLAAVTLCQIDTNAPIIEEFRRSAIQCSENPKTVYHPDLYFGMIVDTLANWSNEHHMRDLTLTLMECWRRAADKGCGGASEGKDIQLALAYMGVARWQPALDIFDSYSNQPVVMPSDGPWGPAFMPVLPSREAAYCRGKLGLPVTRNPKEFDMGKPVLCLHERSTFITDANGLWIGIAGQLLHLDFDLKTNLVINLPMDASVPITCLCLTASNIWIGTEGDGLLEFDKGTHQCRRLTVKDGLLMDVIACLQPAGDVLWIGYGYNEDPGFTSFGNKNGGLGQLDLSTRRFTSFTPSLAEASLSPGKIPRNAVNAVISKTPAEAWFFMQGRLGHYQGKENIWEQVSQADKGCCLAMDAEHLYVGQYECLLGGTQTGPLGLNSFSFRDNQWRSFQAVDGLPSKKINLLILEDADLWLGGMGYIALLDTKDNQIRKIAYIRAKSVDQIQVGGGYVWAQYDWHLHRASLSDIR
jgi:hypothetical protein